MHKKLHKDLYSKRNLQRTSLKPLNNKDNTSIIEDSEGVVEATKNNKSCLLYTSPSPRDVEESTMPSYA